ncbi:MAG TPA: hypothetical protein VHG28_11035 [Longimicrobiaceae bacterium]|nr:hypothetical protein [Longimicrobiaceae bacterium]
MFQSYRVSGSTFHNFRHEVLQDPVSWSAWGDAYKHGVFSGNFEGTFRNYWGIVLNSNYDPENYDDEMTRGGPLMLDPAAVSASLRVNSDRREKLSFEPSFGMDDVGAMGWGWRGGMAVSYRPSYRRTFSVSTRLNVTFSRALTLQLFTQPFLSVGNYTAYKQFTQPRTFDFETFEEGAAVTGPSGVSCAGGRTCRSGNERLVDFDGDGRTDFSFGERDFRVRSLRGNAVLRWEYRPGSTLFFVWQQRRSYQDLEASTFRLGGEARDLLTDRPANVFIIKANYWLSL